jgi:hypothetical protein
MEGNRDVPAAKEQIMRVSIMAQALCGIVLLCGTVFGADSWGNLKGRFVYDGQPPVRKPINITADVEFCGKKQLLEEHLVVNPTNNGVANVIVWLFLGRGDTAPQVHESYAKTARADVVLDSAYCRFEPHVCLLRTTQTLILRNSDPIGDSAKIDTLSNPPINLTLPTRAEVRHQFTNEERLPARVSCGIHPWESGWLLVKELPYMAVSDEDGRFQIENLPVGTWTFQVWHEQAGYVDQVKIDGKPTSWARGRVQIDIQAGENDLGELILAPSLFAQ